MSNYVKAGYEGTRPRGHSSLIGALDAQVAISRDAENNIVTLVEYMKDGKDGPEGAKLISRLEAVDLGVDDEGDEISSCVIVPVMPAAGDMTTPRASDKGAKPPRGAAKIAHEALFETIGDKGMVPPPDPHIPAGRNAPS